MSSSSRRLRSLWNCCSVSRLRQLALSALVIALAVLFVQAAQISPPAAPPPQAPQQQQDQQPEQQKEQPQKQAPDPRARIRTTVELVVVPVTVKDSKGNLVADLGKNDFRILEDGVEQQVSAFSTEAAPLSVVVLLDDDLKPKAADQLRKSLLAIAGAFSESDEVGVAKFASFFTPVMDFTKDNDRLMAELKKIVSGEDTFPDPESNAAKSSSWSPTEWMPRPTPITTTRRWRCCSRPTYRSMPLAPMPRFCAAAPARFRVMRAPPAATRTS